MDGRIIVLKERILRNLQHNWTVKDLAESIDISKSYLQKQFKSETGLSPIKYIQHLRLEKAKQLLEARQFLRIQEIFKKIIN